MKPLTHAQLTALAERSVRMLARKKKAHGETKHKLRRCIQNNPDFEHIGETYSGNEQVEALSEKLRAAYRVEYPSEWHRGFNEGLDAAKIIISQHFAKEQGNG